MRIKVVWLALAASLLVTLMVGVILKTKTSINFEWIARALMNEGKNFPCTFSTISTSIKQLESVPQGKMHSDVVAKFIQWTVQVPRISLATPSIPRSPYNTKPKIHTLPASETLPESLPGRTFVGTWLLAMCVFTSAYSGVLTSLLTVPKITIPVDSLEELVSYGKIPWNLERGTYMHARFARSKSKLSRKIYQGAGIVGSAWDLRGRIKRERISIFTSHFEMMQIMHHDYMETGQCNYYIGKVPLASSHLSLAFPKGSSLVPIFNKRLTSLVETGQVTRHIYNLTYNAKPCMVRPGKENKVHTPIVLTLDDLAGVFFLLAGGILFSIFVFLGECLFHRFKSNWNALP
ncbi:uncharacterized protein LOC122252797 [Penaeus japonicus]|uniref:uncharacterized protein LOC122252797 n=1 Tax=Penaeus japonicus TaxID=27405 RepID=UPI001C7179EB|nr:uncharacterized protein LOC122252797 [Penaeus japonicus]